MVKYIQNRMLCTCYYIMYDSVYYYFKNSQNQLVL